VFTVSRPTLDQIEKHIEQLKAQKQAILSRDKKKERNERTKKLIEIGAIIEKGLKINSKYKAMALVEYLIRFPDNVSKMNAFLEKQEPVLKEKTEKSITPTNVDKII
jgi:hypothetical protein